VTFTVTVQLASPSAKLALLSVTLLAVLVTLPPHWLAAGTPEMLKPACSVSVKPKPSCAGLPAPLLMVKLNTLTAPGAIDAGAKALAKAVPTTVRLAVLLALPALPVSTLLTPPLVLAYAPVTVLVTLTLTVQLAPAAKLPPLRETALPLAAAVTLPPVQVVLVVGVLLFSRLVG
jgi:hypothetical protein